MAQPKFSMASSGGVERTDDAEVRMEIEYANSNRNLAARLGGTSVAIMTFFLFFGFDRAKSGEIDSGFFMITLGFIILTIFLFVYTASFYYAYMEALLKRSPDAQVQHRKADSFFYIALGAIMLEPSLVMFTARLTEIAVFALLLWLASLVMLSVILRSFRHSGHAFGLSGPSP